MIKMRKIVFAIIGIFALGITSTLLANPASRFWEPQSQAFATPTPSTILCTEYKNYPEGTCNNTTCPTGRYCSQKVVAGSTEGDGKLCQQYRTDGDNIYDCCPAGMILNPARTTCIIPTAMPTPAPSKVFCDQYKNYPDGTCNNNICPSGRYCAQNTVNGAAGGDGRLCQQNRTDGDNILDCCPAGMVLNGTKTACVAPTPIPTKAYCDQYKNYPDGTCSNNYCPSDRYCSQNTVSGVNDDGKRCQQNRTDGDNILDCCPAGMILNPSRNACIVASTTASPASPTTPLQSTPKPTTTPTESVTQQPASPSDAALTTSGELIYLIYRIVILVIAQ